MLKLLFCFLCLLCIKPIKAEYLPAHNSVLNYTQVMFEFDEVDDADSYKLMLNENGKNIQSVTIKTTAFLSKNILKFGKKYTWQVKAYSKKKLLHTSAIFNFSIANSTKVDISKIKFSIEIAIKNKYNDDILFIDNMAIAINRKGEPVWYLPDGINVEEDKNNFRTLQMHETGTITYINNSNCYEVDINGNTLWKAPNDGAFSGDAIEYYHHDFAKTPYNSYICASYKFVEGPNFFEPKNKSRVRYNTLVEYDVNNTLLWTWNEKDHVAQKTIFENDNSSTIEVAGTHQNGFIFNKKESSLFLSFRNTSQIIKIAYPSGKVLYNWNGKTDTAKFYQQHGPSLTHNGDLLIYNNNIVPNADKSNIINPTIMLLSNPKNDEKSKLLWEYECAWKNRPNGIQSKEGFVKELNNNNFLVSVGGTERIFEISKSKEIVWEALCTKYNADSNKLLPFTNYRCYNSSSLYPIYFTLQKSKKNSTSILLNNVGTEDDEYSIGMYLEENNAEIIKNIKTTVAAGKSVQFNLVNHIQKFKGKKIAVEVHSVKNKSMVKNVALFYN
jgi:hypothetical protein